MTGSAGGVYGARRTASLKNTKFWGEVWKGGDKTAGADGKWTDFENNEKQTGFFVSFWDRF